VAVKTATTVDPFDDARQRHAAGVFGMWLFLVMLAMLFGASILGYLVVRVNADPMEPFVPDDAPALPHLLLVSTVALLLSSYTITLVPPASGLPREQTNITSETSFPVPDKFH
jgi:heme/copper-type cytochrome/quinol oxidase subunit 3